MAVLSPISGQTQASGTVQSRVDPNNPAFRKDSAVKDRLDLLKSGDSSLARPQKSETSGQDRGGSGEVSGEKVRGRGSLVDISV